MTYHSKLDEQFHEIEPLFNFDYFSERHLLSQKVA